MTIKLYCHPLYSYVFDKAISDCIICRTRIIVANKYFGHVKTFILSNKNFIIKKMLSLLIIITQFFTIWMEIQVSSWMKKAKQTRDVHFSDVFFTLRMSRSCPRNVIYVHWGSVAKTKILLKNLKNKNVHSILWHNEQAFQDSFLRVWRLLL